MSKSLIRAVQLLKSVGIEPSPPAAVTLAISLDGKLSAASDADVCSLLRDAIGVLKSVFAFKVTAAVDPVAAVMLAVKSVPDVPVVHAPVEPVAPVEQPAPVEPEVQAEDAAVSKRRVK